jgi:hypothetical protein
VSFGGSRGHRRSDLPYRSRIHSRVETNASAAALSKARGVAVLHRSKKHEPTLVVPRQDLVTTKAHARQVVVPRCQDFLQQPTPTQLRRIDVARPLRETRCRPTGRSIWKPSRLEGSPSWLEALNRW